MINRIYRLLNKKYPPNYILKKPYKGVLVLLLFCFAFMFIYRPFQEHESRYFNLVMTMAVYSCVMALPVLILIKILRWIPWLSKDTEWTILKEMISIVFIILGIGTTIYFAGFLLEAPGQRWNLPTFIDSCKYGVLIGVIPFLFFTILNYRYLLFTDMVQNLKPAMIYPGKDESGELIRIESQLKKEELSFYPDQFIYAESEGNYVVFYLRVDQKEKEKVIRNSISNIEQQLSDIPYFMRTHRAFIVNVMKVLSKKGNTLGYHLKLSGTDAEIPVSRQKTVDFNQLIQLYE